MENLTTDQQNQLNQLNGIDQSTLQSLLGGANGSGSSLIPESLTNALTVGFIVINVVSILFLIAYILSVVRKWKVQTAILRMHKDVAEIKAHMVGPQVAPVEAPVAEPIQEPQASNEETKS